MTQNNLLGDTMKNISSREFRNQKGSTFYSISDTQDITIWCCSTKDLLRDTLKNISNRECIKQKRRHSTAYQAPKIHFAGDAKNWKFKKKKRERNPNQFLDVEYFEK